MKNKILNNDLKFNIAGLLMDRDRIYAFLKKITPIYWYTRPTTKFVLKKYQKKNLTCVEIGVDYGLNAKTLLKLLSIKKLFLVDAYQDELDSISGDERFKSAQRFL